MAQLQYALLQVRDAHDPMRAQEARCFARALGCQTSDIAVYDLLGDPLIYDHIGAADLVLLGGSGDYSAAGEGDWLSRALNVMRELHARSKPTFASCWGFQAFARALGGNCIHDPERAELGTIELVQTAAGRRDPLFSQLPAKFTGLAGHEDRVDRLPEGATLLASSDLVANQAFCFADRPIYCTQFHPELDRAAFLERVEAYPRYVQRIAGVPADVFAKGCRETPESNTLLRRYVKLVFGA